MALVSSGSEAPSYPRFQNTSSARSSASSTSNCRVRPEGMATSHREKMLPALDRRLAGPVHFNCTNRYRKSKWRDSHVQTTRGQGGGGDWGVERHRGGGGQAAGGRGRVGRGELRLQ